MVVVILSLQRLHLLSLMSIRQRYIIYIHTNYDLVSEIDFQTSDLATYIQYIYADLCHELTEPLMLKYLYRTDPPNLDSSF